MEVVEVLFPLFQVFGFLDFEFLETLDWASGECIVQIRLRGGILVVYVSVLDSFYGVCHFILSLTLENYKTTSKKPLYLRRTSDSDKLWLATARVYFHLSRSSDVGLRFMIVQLMRTAVLPE